MAVIIIKFVAVIILGYLLGSIPFGLLLSRRKGNIDVRKFGSGKTGATNVLRTSGKKVAILAAALDVLKGSLAVIFAGLIMGGSFIYIGELPLGATAAKGLAAIAAVSGHIWPVFYNFRGGRGVSVFFGCLLALSPIVGLSGGAILILIAGSTRYVSLGSIIGAVACYILLAYLYFTRGYPIEYLTYVLISTLIIIVMHRDNIERLITGKERKLGEKAQSRELPPTS